MENEFLPISYREIKERNWDSVDFVLVSGDAYVDHPSFGTAIIGRTLERYGYKVGILAQPNWKDKSSFEEFGRPRLGFLVGAGNMDSMVNHYTVNKKRRKKDSYSPGGQMGKRPDRATIVYCNKIREAYGDIPIIIGGIEASLRRFAHYDYWEERVRNSILTDSSADILVFGMGEKPIIEIAECLQMGMEAKYIRHVNGTCYTVTALDEVYDYIEIESAEAVKHDKIAYAKAFKKQFEEQNPFLGKPLIQKHDQAYVVQNPPSKPLSQLELDDIYEYPYQRKIHPMYEALGGIPALEEVEFSLLSVRGCYGSCSFCAITFHQGKIIQSRSHESLVEEAKKLVDSSNFKGYIHDVGGPTANFRKPSCSKQLEYGTCKNKQCLFPKPCDNLEVDHEDYIKLLRKLRNIPKIKKVFIRSGIRYDYVVADKNKEFLKELCEHHVSGLLKVAPEHVDPSVLKLMGKPKIEVFEKFSSEYEKMNKKIGKEQYLVPYLISSHPGSTLKSAIKLASYLKKIGYIPEQVQDFYPTPGTMSSAMYYTELNLNTMEKLYIPKTNEEKHMQRALLQFNRRENYELVKEALTQANRLDLIGNGPECLIKDSNQSKQVNYKKNNSYKKKYTTKKKITPKRK